MPVSAFEQDIRAALVQHWAAYPDQMIFAVPHGWKIISGAVTLITKYRYEVLAGDVGQRCRELLREIARSKEMQIYAGSINRNHVHMLISIPPNLSVSRAVQYLKGQSSHQLLSEFASLRKRYW